MSHDHSYKPEVEPAGAARYDHVAHAKARGVSAQVAERVWNEVAGPILFAIGGASTQRLTIVEYERRINALVEGGTRGTPGKKTLTQQLRQPGFGRPRQAPPNPKASGDLGGVKAAAESTGPVSLDDSISAELGAAELGPDVREQVGGDWVNHNLENLGKGLGLYVPFAPPLVDGLNYEGRFHFALRERITASLLAKKAAALRALMRPHAALAIIGADVKRLRKVNVYRQGEAAADLIGAQFKALVIDAVTTLAPRVLAAKRTFGDQAKASHVATAGALEAMVAEALMQSTTLHADVQGEVVEVRVSRSKAARRVRAKEAAAQATMPARMLQAKRDLWQAKLALDLATPVIHPWDVYVAPATRTWLDRETEAVTGVPAERWDLHARYRQTTVAACAKAKSIATRYTSPPVDKAERASHPIRQALQRFVRVIDRAHLPEAAAEYQAALVGMQQLGLDLMQLSVSDARAATGAVVADLRSQRAATGPALERQFELENRILAHRQALTAGRGLDQAALLDLALDTDAVTLTSRFANIASKAAQIIHAGTKTGAVFEAIQLATTVRDRFAKPYLALRQALAAARALAAKPGKQEAAKQARRSALADASRALAEIQADGQLQRDFDRTIEAIRNSEPSLLGFLIELALMIGLTVLSAGIGAAVGGAVRGLMSGTTAARWAGAASAVLTEAGVNTLGGKLMGSDGKFLTELATTLTGKGVSKIFTKINVDLDSPLMWRREGAHRVYKGTVDSLEAVTDVAASFTATRMMETGSQAGESVEEWFTQGLMIGASRLIKGRLETIEAHAQKAGLNLGKDLRAQLQAAKAQAEGASRTGGLTATAQAAEEYDGFLGAVQVAFDAASDKASPALDAARETVQAARGELHSEDLLAVRLRAMGLKPVDDSQTLWQGKPAQLAAVNKRYGGEPQADGTHRVAIGGINLVFADVNGPTVRTKAPQAVVQQAGRGDGPTRIEAPLDEGERARIAVQGSAIKHAQVDLHSHGMGNVSIEQMTAELERSGHGIQEGDVSPYQAMLRHVEAIANGKNAAKLLHKKSGDQIETRGPAGDALAIAKDAKKKIETLVERYQDADHLDVRKAIVEAIEALAKEGVEKSLRASHDTDFNSAYEIRDELVQSFYGVPEREAIMGSAKSIGDARAALVKHFAGRPVVQGRVHRAIELERKRSRTANEERELASLREQITQQFAYDRYSLDTLVRLARDKVTYTEQSNSIKKLMTRFDEGQIEWVRERAIAEHPDLAADLRAVEVRYLAMITTNHVGDRTGDLDDVALAMRQQKGEGFDDGARNLRELTKRRDVVGIDVAGSEHFAFNALGRKRLAHMLGNLVQMGKASGRQMVFRPHVGEGGIDTVAHRPFQTDANRQVVDGEFSHVKRARANVDEVLKMLTMVGARFGGRLPPEVSVRLGHMTHATPAQLAQVKALGVTIEVNLHSNQATGSLTGGRPAAGQGDVIRTERPEPSPERDQTFPSLQEHALASMIFHDIDVVLSTDGHEVMNTTLGGEFARAWAYLAKIIANDVPIRISVADARSMGWTITTDHEAAGHVEVKFEKLVPEKKALFENAMAKFYETAARHARRGKQ